MIDPNLINISNMTKSNSSINTDFTGQSSIAIKGLVNIGSCLNVNSFSDNKIIDLSPTIKFSFGELKFSKVDNGSLLNGSQLTLNDSENLLVISFKEGPSNIEQLTLNSGARVVFREFEENSNNESTPTASEITFTTKEATNLNEKDLKLIRCLNKVVKQDEELNYVQLESLREFNRNDKVINLLSQSNEDNANLINKGQHLVNSEALTIYTIKKGDMPLPEGTILPKGIKMTHLPKELTEKIFHYVNGRVKGFYDENKYTDHLNHEIKEVNLVAELNNHANDIEG